MIRVSVFFLGAGAQVKRELKRSNELPTNNYLAAGRIFHLKSTFRRRKITLFARC